MRTTFIILLLFLAEHLYSQTVDQVGQLRLSDAKIIQVDTVSESICGLATKAVRLTVIANTMVQLSCNYGDPSKNLYGTVKNKVHIFYAYDATGAIHNSMIDEIKEYAAQQEAWAQQYNSSKDFTYLGYTKSFYVNNETIIPFIWTGAENPEDYQLFYINKQVYKIAIVERNGLGGLSSFVEQNMYFTEGGQRVDLGNYIKNIELVRQIIARH